MNKHMGRVFHGNGGILVVVISLNARTVFKICLDTAAHASRAIHTVLVKLSDIMRI